MPLDKDQKELLRQYIEAYDNRDEEARVSLYRDIEEALEGGVLYNLEDIMITIKEIEDENVRH